MIDMVLPILTLTAATVYFMIDSGAVVLAANGEPFSVLGSFENTNVGSSLVYGALCSLVVSIGLAMRLKLGAKNWIKAAPQGHGHVAGHQHPAVCLDHRRRGA